MNNRYVRLHNAALHIAPRAQNSAYEAYNLNRDLSMLPAVVFYLTLIGAGFVIVAAVAIVGVVCRGIIRAIIEHNYFIVVYAAVGLLAAVYIFFFFILGVSYVH